MTVSVDGAQVQKNESSVDLSATSFGLKGASPVSLVRGPYLQMGTDCSIVFRWDTDQPTESVVYIGVDPESLTRASIDLSLSTRHEVELLGLEPETKYYYAVGDCSGFVALDNSQHFTTYPRQGIVRPLRVWVVGDAGRATADQQAVFEAFEAKHQDKEAAFWLMLGDNAYNDGTLDQYQQGVFDIYEPLLERSVVWPAFGNHDGHSASSVTETGPYFDLFTFPKFGEAGGVPSHHAGYYSFDYGNVHFICLDSFGSGRTSADEMLDWARQDIAQAQAKWNVAFFHHPPYTKGSHDSDIERDLIEIREKVIPVLEESGVDIVLCGHSHSYERTGLVDGHYGASDTLAPDAILDGSHGRPGVDGPYRKQAGSHTGTVYVVAGTSGRADPFRGTHPVMVESLSVMGSLLLDIEGDMMRVRFIDEKGDVRDHFAIEKRDLPTGDELTV